MATRCQCLHKLFYCPARHLQSPASCWGRGKATQAQLLGTVGSRHTFAFQLWLKKKVTQQVFAFFCLLPLPAFLHPLSSECAITPFLFSCHQHPLFCSVGSVYYTVLWHVCYKCPQRLQILVPITTTAPASHSASNDISTPWWFWSLGFHWCSALVCVAESGKQWYDSEAIS